MQKYYPYSDKKASILIWAIFLSIIISVTFAMISSKITKNINKNSDRISIIENYDNNILLNKEDKVLENGYNIVFEKKNIISRSLEKNGEININTIINQDSYIDLYVEGSIVNYKVISYSGSIGLSSSGVTEKGIVDSFKRLKFNYDNDKDHKIINIKNLGGYSNITLSGSGNINLETNNRKYTIINKIGNKAFIKSSGIINN